MGCACKGGGAKFTVVLPGGLKVTKSTESAAMALAAKHPGAKVEKKTT